MKRSWLFAILLLIATLAGTFSYEQQLAPNQELILRFSNAHANPSDTQNTAHRVAVVLKILDVSNMHVHWEASGFLKISYHSTVAPTIIQKELLRRLGSDAFYKHTRTTELPQRDASPLKKSSKTGYDLEVYNLYSGLDSNLDFGIKSILNQPIKNHYLVLQKYTGTSFVTTLGCVTAPERLTYNYFVNTTIAIGNQLSNNLHVRAGPTSCHNKTDWV